MLGVLAAAPELVHDRAYNVGATAENYRIRDLAALVHDVLPECDVELAEGASADPRSYRVDFGRFETAFPDHCAEWTAREGTKELAAAYRDAERWARAAVEDRAPSSGWPRDLSLVVAAAFHAYQRGAVDYQA